MIPVWSATLVSVRNAVNDFGDFLSRNDVYDAHGVIMSHHNRWRVMWLRFGCASAAPHAVHPTGGGMRVSGL